MLKHPKKTTIVRQIQNLKTGKIREKEISMTRATADDLEMANNTDFHQHQINGEHKIVQYRHTHPGAIEPHSHPLHFLDSQVKVANAEKIEIAKTRGK